MSATFSIVNHNENVLLYWDGLPPYWLERTDSLTPVSWRPEGAPTMLHGKVVHKTGQMGYFRLMECVPLLDDIAESGPAHLIWLVPEIN
jgi:hypothetical protein